MGNRIVVPDGMLKAARDTYSAAQSHNIEPILEAALLWLSENPILPTAEQLYSTIGKLPVDMCDIVWTDRDRAMVAEWQRTMFLATEPEVPEEIKDMLYPNSGPAGKVTIGLVEYRDKLAEALRRGKQVSR